MGVDFYRGRLSVDHNAERRQQIEGVRKGKARFFELVVLERDGVILRLAKIRAGEVVVGKKSSLEIGAGKPALRQIAFIEKRAAEVAEAEIHALEPLVKKDVVLQGARLKGEKRQEGVAAFLQLGPIDAEEAAADKPIVLGVGITEGNAERRAVLKGTIIKGAMGKL